MDIFELKPLFSRIFFPKIIGFLLFISIFIFTFFLYIEISINIFLIIGVLILLILGIIILINILFLKNTTFNISNKKIVRHSNFFHELKKSVPIKQITNIDYSISFFWDKIFNTGSIKIFTAGSKSYEINLFAILKVKKVYNDLLDILKFKNNNQKLLKIIKPNFIIPAFFIAIPLSLFFTFSFGMISISLIKSTYVFIIFIFIFLFLSFFIIFIFVKMAYKQKRYDFFNDKLEYYDGFLTFNKKSVPFKRITNISLNRNFFDRIFGVGKISIETAGSNLVSEININYIENSEEVVKELKEILKTYGDND
jgi:membrane protein YdbS with pleckstrin-like domain